MEYANHLKEYAPAQSDVEVAEEVAAIRKIAAEKNENIDVYKFCYSSIDLTTLSCNDSTESVTEFAKKAVEFYDKYPHIPNVASICIYPSFVETVGLAVDGSPMRITSVAGGFPAAQTFLEVKMLEVAMAVENGADEIDIVLNVGKMLKGHYDEAANEVEVLRKETDSDIVLKVIIESGALKTPELIRTASLLSMFAGADFVKTSTGKIDVAATPEAAVVMCHAIKDYYEKTGRKVGFKAAGGVRTPEDAALYYTIVEEILGKEWITTDLFRIGASSAANNILSAIEGKTVKYY
ncbi:MAG: deoxyribose-phosphate aldolase [Alistipes sp.]|nr:deoxyribose-phosphate aldolase [Alistipes sp.]